MNGPCLSRVPPLDDNAIAMDLHDLVGYGVCHRDPARTLEGAWLCLRCTGLYAGGLTGLWLGPRMGRSFGLGVQVAICVLLLAPMGIDGLILGRGSPMDVVWFRGLNGTLAGIGSGLFLGARGLTHVQWPRPLAALGRFDWAWAVGLPAVAAVALALGQPLPMDVLAVTGLAALCMAGSATALRLVRWAVGRVSPSTPAVGPFPAWALALLVVCELALTSVTPSQYKPGGRWFHMAVDWIAGLLSG